MFYFPIDMWLHFLLKTFSITLNIIIIFLISGSLCVTLLVEQLVRSHGGHQISMTERIANREVFDLFKEVMINQSLEV